MQLARRVFLLAAVYGILALVPQYFMAPPDTRPELFYGFIGVALAWQVAFLGIARDPVRYRLIMIPAILEKLAFGIPVVVLYLQKRLPAMLLTFGIIDLVLAVLFWMSYGAVKKEVFEH